jgi:hypothetical protein
MQSRRSLINAQPALGTDRVCGMNIPPVHIACTWCILSFPCYVGAISTYGSQLTAPLRAIVSIPRQFIRSYSVEELLLCHAWCSRPVFRVPLFQPLINLEPPNTWWDWNCWFVMHGVLSFSLIKVFAFPLPWIPQWPRTQRSITLFCLDRARNTSFDITFNVSRACKAAWPSEHVDTHLEGPFLDLCLQRQKSQKFLAGTLWHAHQVKRLTSYLILPHAHTPASDPPAILHLSVFYTSPLDKIFMGQVSSQCLHVEVTNFEGSPRSSH